MKRVICDGMKALITLILVLLAGTAYGQSNLPACQGNDVSKWSNCVGNRIFSDGDKSVGEYKDGKLNGQAIKYLFNRSMAESGIYKDDILVSLEHIDPKLLAVCPVSGKAKCDDCPEPKNINIDSEYKDMCREIYFIEVDNFKIINKHSQIEDGANVHDAMAPWQKKKSPKNFNYSDVFIFKK